MADQQEEDSVIVREFDAGRDRLKVEEMEKSCQVGQEGKPTLYVDCMGDPLCRIRHSPPFLMLVAEYRDEIVGVIRGIVRTVTTGKGRDDHVSTAHVPVYANVAYVLGLRVSLSYRRLGIGTKLVRRMEEWCKLQGSDYAYIATDGTNQASLNLFTLKCGYSKFRSPTILVQPVHRHHVPVGPGISVVRLAPRSAETIYRREFSSAEFFPRDIDAILSNKLSLGTFLALPTSCVPWWDPKNTVALPPNFAVLSMWNTKEIYKLQVKGASRLKRACCRGSRLLDSCLPCMRLPSVPDLFRPFGVYVLYGLHMEGKHGKRLMQGLCRFAHNMAREDEGCAALVAEVGASDPVGEAVPHWRRFSWAEDVWCIKWLGSKHDAGSTAANHWIESKPMTPTLFVDPRDF